MKSSKHISVNVVGNRVSTSTQYSFKGENGSVSYSFSKSPRNVSALKPMFSFLLGFFAIALLMINYAHTANGLGNVTFSGFLQWLSQVNTFPLKVDISSYGVSGNWGLLEGVRLFFDSFAKLFGVVIYLGANVINVLLFFAQFLYFIFVA